MHQIWEYTDAMGVNRKGVMRGFKDFHGSDVSYRFHRLDDAGVPIRFPNGGRRVDILNGPALKTARRVGAMSEEAYGYQPGD